MGLAARKTPNDPEWIVAYITHSLQEAHIIAGKLQSSDVPCRIHQEAGATALGITVGNLGEIKVLVSPADCERAEVILFPEADNKIQASNDKIQVVWQDDGDGAEYYVDDEGEDE